MTPKISVIVPVYNVENLLPRCIDSILSQSFTDFELLLIDDGSPDNCGKICDEYAEKDSRVRVFHKPNGGVSSARNLGLDNAQGEWITFIDSDDYIEQGFLAIPKELSADLLINNYKVVFGDKISPICFESKDINNLQLTHFISKNLVKQVFRVPWAKFFRRSIIYKNKISFIKGVKIGEDSLFMLEYLHYTQSIKFISLASYVYIKEPGIMKKYRLSVEQAIEVVELFIIRYNKLNVKSIDFLRFVFTFYYELIYPKDIESIKCWRNQKTIKQLYKLIYQHIGLRWWLRYTFHPMYFRFKRLFEL